MNTWPVGLSRGPGIAWKEGYPNTSVKIASAASGLPVINELFTFDPMTWVGVFNMTSQADKETIATFYQANKGVAFKWLNPQDSSTYEVIFTHPPKMQLDRISTLWRIAVTFRQYSTVVV